MLNGLYQKYQGRSGITNLLMRETSWSFITSVSGAGLFFCAHAFLAHVMGPKGYGEYFYALSVVNLIALFSKLGLNTACVRFIPLYCVRSEWGLLRGFLRRVNQVAISVSSLGAFVTAIVIYLVRDQLGRDLSIVFWLACLVLPSTVMLQISAAKLQALKRLLLSTAPQEIIRPISLVLLVYTSVFLLDLPSNSRTIMVLEVSSIGVALFAAMYFIGRNLPSPVFKEKPAYQTATWIRTAVPLTMISSLRPILKQSDVIMVGLFLGTTQAGIYGVASRVAMLLSFGANAVGSISAPVISELYSTGRMKELQRMVTLASCGTLALTIVVGFVIITFGRFMLGLFGATFVSGYVVLVILLVGQFFNALTGPVGNLMTMTDHQKKAAQIMFVSVVTNIVLNIVLIPVFGNVGAAISTSTSMALLNVVMLLFVRKKMGVDTTVISIFRFGK